MSLLGAGVALVVAFGAPAMAQQGGGGEVGTFAAGLVGLFGLGQSAPPEIEYRERPPLVVPPRSTLPSPQQRDTARAAANWPNDPDIERRRAAADDSGIIASLFGRSQMLDDRAPSRLSNDELSRGRVRAPASDGQPVGGQGSWMDDNNRRAMLDTPQQQMRDNDSRRAAEAARDATEFRPGAEPRRRLLSDPPPGLRQPTQRVAAGAEAPVVRGGEREDLGVRDFQRQQAR